MSRHWKEKFDATRHKDQVTNSLGGTLIYAPSDGLIEKWVYFVTVYSFTFQFQSKAQMTECLEFFSQKIHSSSREPGVVLEHYWQRWYERLPLWLSKEPKRTEVIKAIQKALVAFES